MQMSNIEVGEGRPRPFNFSAGCELLTVIPLDFVSLNLFSASKGGMLCGPDLSFFIFHKGK